MEDLSKLKYKLSKNDKKIEKLNYRRSIYKSGNELTNWDLDDWQASIIRTYGPGVILIVATIPLQIRFMVNNELIYFTLLYILFFSSPWWPFLVFKFLVNIIPFIQKINLENRIKKVERATNSIVKDVIKPLSKDIQAIQTELTHIDVMITDIEQFLLETEPEKFTDSNRIIQTEERLQTILKKLESRYSKIDDDLTPINTWKTNFYKLPKKQLRLLEEMMNKIRYAYTNQSNRIKTLTQSIDDKINKAKETVKDMNIMVQNLNSLDDGMVYSVQYIIEQFKFTENRFNHIIEIVLEKDSKLGIYDREKQVFFSRDLTEDIDNLIKNFDEFGKKKLEG